MDSFKYWFNCKRGVQTKMQDKEKIEKLKEEMEEI